MKKIISLVLVFCMLFSLGVSAFADDQGEAPTQTESGGGESGGGSGGESGGASGPTESGGGSGGGESGGASGGGEPGGSGGDSGGTESGGASGGGESGGGSGGGESGGGSGGGTVTEKVGNVYAGDGGKSVTVGDNPVTFDASGQGDIPQVTRDNVSGAINIDANVNGSDEAVKVEGNTTVIITGQVTSDDDGIVASGGSNVTADSVSAISGYGVEAGGGSTVNVINNVYSEGVSGVYAGGRNATVNVGGAVTSKNSTGVLAAGNKVVSVTGNVSGSDRGIYAVSGNVEVKGTVTATNGTGVYAKDYSTVNAGDVTSANGTGVKAESGSTVTVLGTVTGDGTGIDDAGVYAEGNGTKVFVKKVNGTGGDVTSKDGRSNGVLASGGSTVEVEGTVTGGKNGVEANGSTVTVSGDAIGTDGIGVEAWDSDVIVSGKVEGDVRGIYAKNSTVEVGGVENADGNRIGVIGDGYQGVFANEESTVKVQGTVTATNGTGVAVNGSTVVVDGDVIGYKGVHAVGSTVEVSGDVTGAETGLFVRIEDGDTAAKQSTVIVEGTVKTTEEDGYTIELNVPDDASLETVKDVLPEIVVQSIDSKADYVVCTGDTSEQKREDIATAVLESIKYIVETEVKNTDGSDSTVTVDLVRYNTEEAVETKDLLNEDGTTKKTLTVATTSTQLVVAVDKTKGSVVGVTVGNEKSASNPDGNVITHDEDKDQWIITVGIGGGLKVIATIDKPAPEPQPEPEPLPVDPDPVKPDPSPRSETVPVRQETVSTALVKLDYGHKNPLENILIIDMTTTNVAAFLTHTLRTFNRRNAIGTVMIKVANGSFTIAANDLLQLLDSEPACTFLVRGDMLEIRVGGETLASLVMTSTV